MSMLIKTADSLAASVGFDLLGEDLGRDIESSLKTALDGGAVFADAADPLSIFRGSLTASIRGIESHPRGELFQDFLRKGPYEHEGEFPAEMAGQRLSDAKTAAAVTFIYSHMVNCFKGAITELLAAGTAYQLLKRLQDSGELPKRAQLYVGDSVMIPRK